MRHNRRNTYIQLRVSEQEKAHLFEAAKHNDMTLSEYIRTTSKSIFK